LIRPPSRVVASVIGTGIFLVALSGLAAAEVASSSKHCLWRVTNARAPFYLLGSVHALQRSDYDKAPAVEEAIKQSQLILFEMDPKEDLSFAQKLAAAARLPRGEQIRGKISPKTYNYLRKITINGMAEWQHLYPWAIAMLLDYPALRGVSTIYGVDNHVAEMARRYSKKTGGVETVDEHIHVFSDMRMIEGEVYLLQALVHAAEASPQFQLDVAAWKSGDTNRLYAMHARQMKEAPTVWWRLLDRRNTKWIPRLEAAIKSGTPTLVVAGALHFSGPRSVIALLQKHGYKIEQL
jgi:uncharacterized protein YbaP (TraB family)